MGPAYYPEGEIILLSTLIHIGVTLCALDLGFQSPPFNC